jgi:hypothetical protein
VSIPEGKGFATTSELCGLLRDQAALMGVQQQLYLIGLPF